MNFMAGTSLRLCVTAALLLLPVAAKANVIQIAVVNGGLEQTTYSASNKLNTVNAAGTGLQQVTGWTSNNYNANTTGYNFVYTSGTVDITGAYLGSGSSYLKLYGTGNGSVNAIISSPDGGKFIAMDGAYQQVARSQVLTGLTVGMDTKVSFYYAGAQQAGFIGATPEAFKVSLTDKTGSRPSTQKVETAILGDVSHGFTGWHYTEVDFMPTASTETLSFLAAGTPNGIPPFTLLGGVSVVPVTPETSTLALLGLGILAVGGLVRRRSSL